MAGAPFLRGTYSTALGKSMLAFALARGFSETEVLRILQTTRQALEDPDARLPVMPALAFWEHVARTLDDPAIPLQLAEAISPNDLGVVGFAALTADSCRQSLQRAARYYELLADTARLVLEETREGMRVEFVRRGERTLALRIMNEITVACLLRIARLLLGWDFDPVKVAFRHPAPRDTTAHRHFFRVPVRFGADWEGLVFPSAVLDRVPRNSNASMGSFFERHAEDQLRRLSSGKTLADRVRGSIYPELMNGEPTLTAVAKRLGTSARTLRRQLDGEHATFRGLVDAVRREHARECLVNTKASITEVAYLLGFSEVSAFSRAFRRWYGKSPRTYRAAS